jgi:hypothetical protein
MKRSLFLFLSFLVSVATLAAQTQHGGTAVDAARQNAARQSMEEYVKQQMFGGTYYYYDAVERKLLALRFHEIHPGVRDNANFTVSCSKFEDQFGRTIDIDFLALTKDGAFMTVQGIVHSVDGRERPYTLVLEKKKTP